MKFDVVIAHYKESLSWIGGLNHPSIRRIFVYTKGPTVPDMNGGRVFHTYLPNVGRESHTYLWHCVHNFHEMECGSMADFTFFVQGSPHYMNPQRIEEWIGEAEARGLPFTLNYRISNPNDFLSAGRCRSWAGETTSAECNISEWCSRYVGSSMPNLMPIFWNACFGVSTGCVLSSERQRLAEIMQRELCTINPECGHFCERLWFLIFRMRECGLEYDAEGLWDFWGGINGSKHYGTMRLLDDGRVGLYDNHNERFWRADGESIVLMNSNRKDTTVLGPSSDGEYAGSFLGAGRSNHRVSRHVPPQE